MNLVQEAINLFADGIPRVSGDEPAVVRDCWKQGLYSPRERG